MKYKIKYFFKSIYDFFRYDLPCGIRNLVIWFPIIWKDRSWDHYYLFRIMQKKLFQLKSAIDNGHCANPERITRRIKLCELLLDRIIKDDYYLMKTPFNGKKRQYDHQDMMQKQDLELLFNTMKKHVLSWWD